MLERIRRSKAALPTAAQARDDGTARAAVGASQWRIAARTFRGDRLAMAGLIVLVLLLAVTILAPWVAPANPTQINYDAVEQPPSGAHLFGTDDLGRDVLSRVLWGGRESLRVAVIAIAIATTGGVALGLVSGYYGGVVDTVIQRLVEIAMAFPSILLLLSIVAILGPSLTTVLIAIGFASIPSYSRLVRGSVLSVKHNKYIVAAHVTGAHQIRVMLRHILPNMLAPVLIFTTLGLGDAILLTAGLSYIGLGAQPPSPEWGAMLLYGRNYLRDAWWMSVFPGVAIFIAVLSINIFSEGLRDALDPRLRT